MVQQYVSYKAASLLRKESFQAVHQVRKGLSEKVLFLGMSFSREALIQPVVDRHI